jgi:hypothetical protein
MKRAMLVAALILLPIQLLLAAGAPADIFSDGFKASVNASMAQPDREKHTRFLMEALRHGTDSEVFHVFPVLFPLTVLGAAKKAQVCTAEIQASISNVSGFTASPAVGRQAFVQSHATKIRADTNHLITCIDQYYANGKLTFPTPSVGSVKPKPGHDSP